jgi:hypothetical protein
MGGFWFHEEGNGAGCGEFKGSGEGALAARQSEFGRPAEKGRELKRALNSTRCYTMNMKDRAGGSGRVFKTAWFSKAASKAHIGDAVLGQADDLGGGVFKKRLGKNLYRSIVVARGGRYWVFEYLYAKKDRANIEDADLAKLRKLAKAYEMLTKQEVEKLIDECSWMEICNGN